MAVAQFLARFVRGILPGHSDVPRLSDISARHNVASGDLNVAAYVAGPDDPSATVVFIHGFTLAAESYFLQVQHLIAHHPTVRSLLMDLRGHGETGEVPPELCTIDATADDVLAVIESLAPEGPLYLVGHSLGGHVVLNAIRRSSPEIYSRIKGVMLIATSIDSLSAQGTPQLLTTQLGDTALEAMQNAPEMVNQFRDEMGKLLAPALAATVFKRISTPYNLVKFHAEMIHRTPLATFIGFFDDLEHHSEVAAAERLSSLPGFVLVGNDDHVTPLSQSNRIMELWPSATLRKCDRCGHMMILEAPTMVNEALDDLLSQQENP